MRYHWNLGIGHLYSQTRTSGSEKSKAHQKSCGGCLDEEAEMTGAGKETGITLGSGGLVDDEPSNDVDSDPSGSTSSDDDFSGSDTDSVLEREALVMDMYGLEEDIIGDSDNLFSYD
jgi:hypothetical protein